MHRHGGRTSGFPDRLISQGKRHARQQHQGMVLDLPICSRTGHCQTTGGTQAESRKRLPGQDVCAEVLWDREIERLRPVRGPKISICKDLFADIIPIAVLVEVDPSIQSIRRPISILQVNLHLPRRGARRRHDQTGSNKAHPIFVIRRASRVVGIRVV